MKVSRGRKSAASKSVATIMRPEAIPRPDSPYDLDDEESAEWWAVVDRMPADWFGRETHALLSQYCRHVVSARRIAQLIKAALKAEAFDVDAYDQLLKLQEREGRALSSLATRMRITQQATYDKSKRKKPVFGRKPWEADE
jgi:hypothetical protein